MMDSTRSRAEPVSAKPVVIVHQRPAAPGVPLASGTFALPFDAIRHLLSDRPLRRPFRGEPVDVPQQN